MGPMTTATTSPEPTVAAQIEARLTAALQPIALEVRNDSRHHAGHMGDDGSGATHFTVIAQSAAFAGLSRVARQRLVNQALADLIAPGGIHALAMRLSAPDE